MKRVFCNIFILVNVIAFLVGCNSEPNFKEYDYPEPLVESVSPTSGYTGTEVTVLGSNFGDVEGTVKVYFNGALADVVTHEDGKVVVTVPDNASSGNISMEVWTYSLDNIGTFSVIPVPEILSIESDNILGTDKAAPGDIVTIKGSGFRNDMSLIVVDFNGTPATNIISLDDTEIKVEVPQGFTSGMVKVSVNGYIVEGIPLLNPQTKGDVTSFYLRNYKNPISRELTPAQMGTNNHFRIPADWTLSGSIINRKNLDATDYTGGMLEENGTTFFNIEAGWSQPITDPGVNQNPDEPNMNFIRNGIMYQTITLPAGSYDFLVDVTDHGNQNESKVYIVAAKGESIPFSKDIESNDNVLDCVVESLTTAPTVKPYTTEPCSFELTEETEISLGFSIDMTWNIFYKFEGVRLILK